MKKILIALILSAYSLACQPTTPESSVASSANPSHAVTTDAVNRCATFPPVHDLLALKPLLLKQQLIAADADDDTVRQAARRYVQEKQQAIEAACRQQKELQ